MGIHEEKNVVCHQQQMSPVIKEETPVQEFYSGSTVFITGASGFLGKQLLEKLLRSCDIEKVYLLIRKKRAMTSQERLEQILTDQVFEAVREKQPDFASKLMVVEGDCSELKLGIGQKHWDLLAEEVNIIFHLAATIKLNGPLGVATLTNVRGTREAIELARHCKNLKKFVHVSTAFSNTTLSRVGQKIFEEFHAAPVPPDVMIGLAENARLNDITPLLIRDWPNTYTFTKAIAEDLVRNAGADLPICIVRPAIVMCSYSEPGPGWMDMSCVYGPAGIILGFTLGVLRTFFVDVHLPLPLVPVDYVNNAIIASAWDSSLPKQEGEVPIYTIANEESTITWNFIAKCYYSEEFRRLFPSQCFWYSYLLETKNRVTFKVLTWLLHYIPAYICDAVVAVFRIKLPKNVPSFVKIYSKIENFSRIYTYFLSNQFHFQDQNVRRMLSRMSDKDRDIFHCDLTTVERKRYMKSMLFGLKKYIFKEDPLSEKAIKKQFYFKIANYAVIFLYLYTFRKLVAYLYNNLRLAKNLFKTTISNVSRFGVRYLL